MHQFSPSIHSLSSCSSDLIDIHEIDMLLDILDHSNLNKSARIAGILSPLAEKPESNRNEDKSFTY